MESYSRYYWVIALFIVLAGGCFYGLWFDISNFMFEVKQAGNFFGLILLVVSISMSLIFFFIVKKKKLVYRHEQALEKCRNFNYTKGQISIASLHPVDQEYYERNQNKILPDGVFTFQSLIDRSSMDSCLRGYSGVIRPSGRNIILFFSLSIDGDLLNYTECINKPVGDRSLEDIKLMQNHELSILLAEKGLAAKDCRFCIVRSHLCHDLPMLILVGESLKYDAREDVYFKVINESSSYKGSSLLSIGDYIVTTEKAYVKDDEGEFYRIYQ